MKAVFQTTSANIYLDLANVMIEFSDYWYNLSDTTQKDYKQAFRELNKLFIPLHMKLKPGEALGNYDTTSGERGLSLSIDIADSDVAKIQR